MFFEDCILLVVAVMCWWLKLIFLKLGVVVGGTSGLVVETGCLKLGVVVGVVMC